MDAALLTWPMALLNGGLGNLAAYLAAHVLLCLLPAFFIAGAMSALIPKETVTRFLGRNSSKTVSYPAAAAAGSLLAVCSCTIVPLFAGIYRKGAGLGPAITFLFFAPAANILALVYTGGIIGPDLAIARFVLSLTFGIGIGLIMALLFRADDAAHDLATDSAFGAQGAGMGRTALVFLFVWVALLLAGTLKLDVLTGTYLNFQLPIGDAQGWQAALDRLVPYDAAKGEEGVSVQGVVLIALLAAIGYAAWRGFENISEGANAWTWISLALIAATLLVAALSVQPVDGGLRIGLTGKFFAVAAAFAVLGLHRAPPPERGRAARLAVGVVALREADLPAAGGGRVHRRHDPRDRSARSGSRCWPAPTRSPATWRAWCSACSCTSRPWSRCRSRRCSSSSACTAARCSPT